MSGIAFGQSGISPKRVSSITADSTILFGDITITAGTGVSLSVTGQAITISSSVTAYTDEMAQDAVGNILSNDGNVDFTYDDGTPKITANYTETDPVVGAVSGIVKANGAGVISSAVANTDYITPSLAIALAAAL